MSDVKFKAGDVLVREGYPDWRLENHHAKAMESEPGYLEGNIRLGWRLKERPAERRLAPGWTKGGDTCMEVGCWNRAVYDEPDGESSACADHAESMGAFADAPKVEAKPSVPACKEWCGKRDSADCYVSERQCYGDGDSPCFCSSACRDAGRPLNPAVEEWRGVAIAPLLAPMQAEIDRLHGVASKPRTTFDIARQVASANGMQPSKPRTVGTYGDDGKRGMAGSSEWARMQLGRATGIDRERTGPTRTEVEWRKLPARYRTTMDPDEVG